VPTALLLAPTSTSRSPNIVSPQRYDRSVAVIIPFSSPLRVRLTGLPDSDGHDFGQPPARRETPELQLRRVRNRTTSRPSTNVHRIPRGQWQDCQIPQGRCIGSVHALDKYCLYRPGASKRVDGYSTSLMVYSTAIPTCKCHFHWLSRPSRCMSHSLFPIVHPSDTTRNRIRLW